MNEFKLKARYFRRLPNPFEGKEKSGNSNMPEIYEVIVEVNELPENMNFNTNPRFQNMKTKVVKKIKESLEMDDMSFHLKNRGIVISASQVTFNNVDNTFTILLEDENVHGNIDGGHTYRAILETRARLKHTQYVKLEIMTGIESIFEDVAASRNTSVQVQDQAIAELKNMFEFIKEFIENEPFADNIAYKENDDKDIDLIYIICILYMFNIEKFDSRDVAPVQACTSTQNCMKNFLDTYAKYKDDFHENPYYKMKDIIIDIFKLHDKLQKDIPEYYGEYFGRGSKYGSIKGVQANKSKAIFYGEEIMYSTPKSFIFPILGSMRALVEEYNGMYRWKADPYSYLDLLGKNLVGETIERHRSLGNNPASVGKDSNHWKQLYSNVLMEYMIRKI